MSETENKDKDGKPAEGEPTAELTPEAKEAAVETAQEGGTPEQAAQAAEKEEVKESPEKRDAERKEQAKAFVDELEARGLFEDQAAELALPPTEGASADSAGSPSAPATTESPAPSTDEQPRKRSLAERFAGIGG